MADVERLQVADREIIRLSSDQLRLDVVPGLGGTAISLVRLEDQAELLWRSPWGLRPAAARPLTGNPESVMLDTLPGGWQTIFPNGGDSAVVNGAEWDYDGEARVAWFDWEQAGSSVILKTRLVRSPFALTKIISVNADEVTIGETAKNVGEEHVDVMWGSQLMLGPALLGPEMIIDTGATLVRPDPQLALDATYDDILPWPRSYGPDGMVNLRSLPAADNYLTRSAYLSDFRSAPSPGAPMATVTNGAAAGRAQLGPRRVAAPLVPAGIRRPRRLPLVRRRPLPFAHAQQQLAGPRHPRGASGVGVESAYLPGRGPHRAPERPRAGGRLTRSRRGASGGPAQLPGPAREGLRPIQPASHLILYAVSS